MGKYSIKQVETLSGIKAHTLRTWEQRYEILKPKRTATNIRYYSDEQLRLILNISTLNRNGVKISHIAELRPEQLEQEVLKIESDAHEPDLLLDSMIHAMLDFDEDRFEKTLSNTITRLSFETAFADVVFPFLIRTGVMWQAGSVRVVQEHFISNLIRRKLIGAIESVNTTPKPKAKTFVLFLPENESHELLLLFTEFILRKQGQKVIYLGCSLPLNELDFVFNSFKPDYLVTYLTVPREKNLIYSFFKSVSKSKPQVKMIVGGSQAAISEARLPANIFLVSNVSELLAAIA